MAKKLNIKDALLKSSGPKSVATLTIDFLADGSWNIDFDGVDRISIRRVQEILHHVFRAHAQGLHDIRFKQLKEQNDGLISEKV